MFGFWKRQKQTQTGPGLAVQAGQNAVINVNGITASEARTIALDVFRANLIEFRGIAQATAAQRGEEITEKFISKLEQENPEGLRQAQTPDFQDALFTIQKEFAKAGDEELGDLLVDLLVDRTKQEDRNLMRLVLTESLSTAPKLTKGQIDTLTIVFMLRHAQNNSGTHAGLVEFLNTNVRPFIQDAAISAASFGQLAFAGCGSVSLGEIRLVDIFARVYAGLFRKGFSGERLGDLQIPTQICQILFIPCLNDPSKLQVRALNRDQFMQLLNALTLEPTVRTSLENLFNEGAMTQEEIRTSLLEKAPFMEPLFKIWDDSQMKQFELTSVGMAIGHANAKRVTKVDVAPLSIWIN